MFSKICGTAITAIRAAVPTQEISIEDELEYYGNSLKKAARAKSMIGTDRRRIAWPGQTASDLCLAAAQNLLENRADVKNKIDALIFVSQSPDYDLPATACVLHKKLNLPETCAAFDVNQGCAGFVYGLWLGASLIQSGCRHVLLLAGDVPYRSRDRRNRVMAPIFGDGGSAALLSRQEAAAPLFFSLGADGTGFDSIIIPAGRARLPLRAAHGDNSSMFEEITDGNGFPWQMIDTYMDGKAVFTFTLAKVPAHIREFLERTGTHIDEIDCFALHQANRQIIAEIARKAGLPPEKTPSGSFSRYGNLSSASVPAALCDLFGEAGAGPGRLLLCGYGVGWAWGSCLWQAAGCDFAPVISVPAPACAQESEIWHWRRHIMGESNAE